jgi:4-nitrophenyl phosphatase
MDNSSDKIKALILDMDGVLWRQTQPIGNLPEIFSLIRDKGLQVSLATNNATLTVKQYQQKLASFGVNVESWQVINSPQAARQYIQNIYPEGSPIFVIGEDGLIEEMIKSNYIIQPTHVVAVVVGMDRGLTYEKLCQATLNLRAGADFIATNSDRTFPTPAGLVPGVGAVLALLETASDKKPKVVGKPEPLIYEIALERMNVAPQETLVIGDRLETDILGAQRMGCHTAVVLSGVSTLEQIEKWNPPPDIIGKDLHDVIKML